MTATQENIRSLAPAWSEEQIRDHFAQWGERYTDIFTPAEIVRHMQALDTLGREHPCEILAEAGSEGWIECTILAYDAPGIFSLIAGLLGATGFSIESGNVFTSSLPPLPNAAMRRRLYRDKRRLATMRRRKIIDRFRGRLADTDPREASTWSEQLGAALRQVIDLLDRNTPDDALKARRYVYERVAEAMDAHPSMTLPSLYPVDIDVDNSDVCTRLTVCSQDTPFFLYSLCNALAIREISIEQVRIETTRGQVADVIDVLDRNGKRIEDPDQIDELRFSILLTKQFTFFLGQAPSPYQALMRFEKLTEGIFHDPDRTTWIERFSDPASLQDLARILGASDFLWEDFIRTQYEALLPVLGMEVDNREGDLDPEKRENRLREALAQAPDYEGKCAALNRWKDQEIFRIDLAHILDPHMGVRGLSEHLTDVAEHVVQHAMVLVFDHLVERYGTPRTVAGFATPFSLFGLGKFGGVALGYASDIELLFVYGDHGRTDGDDSLTNAEFFNRFVQELGLAIVARREGVFQIDLRLRPYGASGPMACSLESFCRYYGPAGDALSYERLALVRLRYVAGDRELGQRIERLRDEFIYETGAISFPELHELRARQADVKLSGGSYNAKFSPGALVDLEYCVQMLQTIHGGRQTALRTPRIHLALEALSEAGVIEATECEHLTEAYYFLRRLINALRMLRGNALDLFLPAAESLEFRHLARRMGYRRRRDLDAGRQLFIDFETQTAVVRRFVEKHFGRENIPGSGTGNVVDVLLSDNPSPHLVETVLGKMGLRNPERGLVNLTALMNHADTPHAFCRLAVLAGDVLKFTPDPDMALNNWEQFVGRLTTPEQHFRQILLQPRRMEILLGVFATSQFLADTLIHYPEFMDWVTDPEVLNRDYTTDMMLGELDRFMAIPGEDPDPESVVRRFRRREILRIGIRDLFLKAPIISVTSDLSSLADAILIRTTENQYRILAERNRGDVPPLSALALLALGKLGGRELNYSSDIDLIGVYDSQVDVEYEPQVFFAKLIDTVRASLMRHTVDGYVYRVDFRLRPYGRSGPLVSTETALVRYYQKQAATWEHQAMLKARAVAGNVTFGENVLQALKRLLLQSLKKNNIVLSIRHMRRTAVHTHVPEGTVDVKNGIGGIRDIEFLVQGMQMQYAHTDAALMTGNTLEAIQRLNSTGILPDSLCRTLARHYAFLRRVEHFLQILDDRQLHALPKEHEALLSLGKRALGPEATAETFLEYVQNVMTEVRHHFDTWLRSQGAGPDDES